MGGRDGHGAMVAGVVGIAAEGRPLHKMPQSQHQPQSRLSQKLHGRPRPQLPQPRLRRKLQLQQSQPRLPQPQPQQPQPRLRRKLQASQQPQSRLRRKLQAQARPQSRPCRGPQSRAREDRPRQWERQMMWRKMFGTWSSLRL